MGAKIVVLIILMSFCELFMEIDSYTVTVPKISSACTMENTKIYEDNYNNPMIKMSVIMANLAMKRQHMEIAVNDQKPENDLRQIITLIRPEWSDKNIKFKTLAKTATAGLLNTMIVCSVDKKKTRAIMFRVYGTLNLEEYLNRTNEMNNIELVYELYGFAPNILASYSNGFCYDYIHGEVMTRETMRLPNTFPIIAKQLALLHSIKHDKALQHKSKLTEVYMSVPEKYPESLKNPEDNEIFQKCLPNKEFVDYECKRVLARVQELDMEWVFCHNDTRSENFVWNRQKDTVTFVDWECAGWSPQAFDIAYHFFRYAGIEDMDLSLYPDRSFQMKWLRLYLETYFSQTKTEENRMVSDDDVERLYIQVNTFYLLLLIQGVGAVWFRDEYPEFPLNLVEIAVKNYNAYVQLSDSVLSLQLP